MVVQEGKVKFAAINCESYKPLCQRLSVKYYPTLNLFLAQENQVKLFAPLLVLLVLLVLLHNSSAKRPCTDCCFVPLETGNSLVERRHSVGRRPSLLDVSSARTIHFHSTVENDGHRRCRACLTSTACLLSMLKIGRAVLRCLCCPLVRVCPQSQADYAIPGCEAHIREF